MSKYENKEICSKCGGLCCKNMGCHFSPDDFNEISYDILKREIDKGFISIDWWYGDPFSSVDKEKYGISEDEIIDYVYFLRIRNLNSPIVDPSFGGQCMLLREDGCPLKFELRPKGARLLIPGEHCKSEYTKRECAMDWYKYNDILEKLEAHYNN